MTSFGPTSCLPYTLLYTFSLKMATVISVETLDKSQHSTRLILESRSDTQDIDNYASGLLLLIILLTVLGIIPQVLDSSSSY